MGRNNYGQTYKVIPQGDGQRRSYSQHDNRVPRRGSVHSRIGDFHSNAASNPNKRVTFDVERAGGIQKRGRRMYRSSAGGTERGRPINSNKIRGQFGTRGGRNLHRYIADSNTIRRPPSSGLSGFQWHRVTLESASKYPKEDVYQAIASNFPPESGLKFAPLCLTKQGMNYTFYVESDRVAAKLEGLSMNVHLVFAGSSHPLSIRVERSPPPKVVVSEEMLDKAKQVMSERYTLVTKALDLRSFHTDPIFLREAIFAPLSRSIILKKIVQIIEENIPEVEAIDLSDNRINVLDQFEDFFKKASNLKILYLNNNKIDSPSELKYLRFLKLIDLKLEHNPVVVNMKDGYQIAIRKWIPSLQILDGKDLPKQITFETDTPYQDGHKTNDLPSSKQKVVCNEEAEKIVLQFLDEYFKVYDSDNRQDLINAYHEDSVMSMSVSYNPSNTLSSGMKEYLIQSRNLLRVLDPTRRQKLIHQGRLGIVAFLKDLPKTRHDPTSFTLDVPFATDRLMTFTVTGVFKEQEGDQSMRYFNRMFVVVPQGSGFCIVNETLYITTPTSQQLRTHFKNIVSEPQDRARLVATFSQVSGMNSDWSKRCLEETGWDLGKAEAAFKIAHQEGRIPSEAFGN